jgi:hypothetical protein
MATDRATKVVPPAVRLATDVSDLGSDSTGGGEEEEKKKGIL